MSSKYLKFQIQNRITLLRTPGPTCHSPQESKSSSFKCLSIILLTMCKMPTVSIIVPTYNRGDFLPKTIESLLNQTYQDFELLVIDDASTDNTANLVSPYFEDKRFRFYREEINQGESSAVNMGWQQAKGLLVAIVNSDDPQDKRWLENMIAEIEKFPGYVIYYPNLRIIDSNGGEISKVFLRDWDRKIIYTKLLTCSSAGAVLNKSILPDAFLPRNSEVIYPSDLFQTLKLAQHGVGKRLPNVFGNWTEHQNSSINFLHTGDLALNFIDSLKLWFGENSSSLNLSDSDISHSMASLYLQVWRFIQRRSGLTATFIIFPWRLFLKELSRVTFVGWLLLEFAAWSTNKFKNFMKGLN